MVSTYVAPEVSRAFTVALIALALTLSASLLPAADIGSHPGGSPGGTDAKAQANQSSTNGTATPAASIEESAGNGTADIGTDTEPTNGTGTNATAGNVTGTSTATITTSATPTPTLTPTPTTEFPASDDGGDDDSLSTLLILLFLGFTVLTVGIGIAVTVGDANRAPSERKQFGVIGRLLLAVFDRIDLRLSGLSSRLSRGSMAFVVGVSRGAPGLLDAVGQATSEVVSGLSLATRGTARGLGGLLASAGGGFVAGLGGLAATLGSITLSVPSFEGAASGGEATATTTDARETGPEPAKTERKDTGPVTIEEAWAALEGAVPVRSPQSRTPIEFATAAIDAGFPAEHVASLTAVFQEVAYGGLPATAHRLEIARQAYAALTPYLGTDDESGGRR